MIRIALVEDEAEVRAQLQGYVQRHTRQYGTEFAVTEFADGKAINRMLQLSPVVIDKLGAASVMSGDKRYETADDMQVYLWSNGQYFATSLPKINTEDYKLIGWYDNFGCSGGRKIRILVAVKTN